MFHKTINNFLRWIDVFLGCIEESFFGHMISFDEMFVRTYVSNKTCVSIAKLRLVVVSLSPYNCHVLMVL